jgi:arylsulfatase A-like enzyme
MRSSTRFAAIGAACAVSIALGLLELLQVASANPRLTAIGLAQCIVFALIGAALLGALAGVGASLRGGGTDRAMAWSCAMWIALAASVRCVPWTAAAPWKGLGALAAVGLAMLCARCLLWSTRKFAWLASMRAWLALDALLIVALGVLALRRRDWSAPLEVGGGGDRPSILFVTIDTLRADFVGCFGRKAARTPTLDDLAAHGYLFEHAQTHSVLTGPSHATMLTGLLPIHTGLTENLQRLAGSVPTIAERFSKLGFRTGAFVGGYPVKQDAAALLGRFESYDDDFRTWRGLPRESEKLLLGHWFWTVAEQCGLDTNPRYRDAAAVAEVALPWLDADSPRPFFAWVHFFDPHLPYEPPPSLLSPQARAYQGPARGDWSRMSQLEQAQVIRDPQAMQHMNELYDAEVAAADLQLARVVAAARSHAQHGLWIIVTADHGENFGEHGIYFERDLYEETLHVPLIVEGPQPPAIGQRIAAPVGLVDLAPTMLEIAGAKMDCDGRSLMPLLRGDAWPAHAYLAEVFASSGVAYRRASFAVRQDSWKLIVRPPGWGNSAFAWKRDEERELYDIDHDGGEQHDLAASEDARVVELKGRALELRNTRPAAPLKLGDEDRAALKALGYTK